jgi:nucleotide-binding universal stress UspA family protein
MSPAPPVPARRPDPGPPRSPWTFRRILYPTDLSEAADVAFAHACLIAETFDAELTVYHSIDLRKVAKTAGKGEMADALHDAELAAVRHIEARTTRTSATTRVRVEYGLAPHQAVVAAIAASRPDLTVMSTHGRRGIAHLLLGSVAESAIEQGGRPILCVRGRDHAPAAAYRRILVPTDLRSRGAFPVAAVIAEAFHSEVVAVHVVPFERASLSGLPQGLPAPLPGDGEVAGFLEPEFRGVRVSARVTLGPGWEILPSIAAEEGCDLIVMSTHRHDSVGDAIFGSRAERIVAVAPCPVVVV